MHTHTRPHALAHHATAQGRYVDYEKYIRDDEQVVDELISREDDLRENQAERGEGFDQAVYDAAYAVGDSSVLFLPTPSCDV
jgi:hypothetical protein